MADLMLVVSHRDRVDNLQAFLRLVPMYLQVKGIDYEICVVNQENDNPFNQARLHNIGFAANPGHDCYCFHDVDLIPEYADYSPVTVPTHLCRWVEQTGYQLYRQDTLGGVVMFPADKFIEINGYSNMYQGWGGEDVDVFQRCLLAGLEISRRDGRFRSLPHKGGHRGAEGNPNWPETQKLRARVMQHVEERKLKQLPEGLTTLDYRITRDTPGKIRHLYVTW